MRPEPVSAFDCFVAERRNDLQRIAGYTRGEQQLGDVISQSWILARQLSLNDKLEELRDLEFQEQLLRRLNRFFTNHANRIYRQSISLDHGNDDADAPSDTHPLMRALTSASPDPLTELLNQEEADSTIQVEGSPDIHCSLAGAYVYLLEYFDKSWPKVAAHLNISPLTARKHYRQAEFLACHQHSLPSHMPKGFMPGPWRSPRPEQTLRQLMFEFAYQLTFQQGEGWIQSDSPTTTLQ